MRRPYGRRHKSLQSAFSSAAALHHRSMDPHQCSQFLPLTRSLRHSANCILCLSIKIYFPFLFSFAFYLVAHKLFVTLGTCDEGWFVEMNSIWKVLVCKRRPGSIEPLLILHNALSKREGFCCHPNHTFHLYEQITQEKLNLALEQGRVKSRSPTQSYSRKSKQISEAL